MLEKLMEKGSSRNSELCHIIMESNLSRFNEAAAGCAKLREVDTTKKRASIVRNPYHVSPCSLVTAELDSWFYYEMRGSGRSSPPGRPSHRRGSTRSCLRQRREFP